MSARKNILIYASGRVEEIKQDLCGMTYIVPEMINGDLWRREFEVNIAHNDKDPRKYVATMVGLERRFFLEKTRAQLAADRAEWDARTMKAALWGIANYPGDDET